MQFTDLTRMKMLKLKAVFILQVRKYFSEEVFLEKKSKGYFFLPTAYRLPTIGFCLTAFQLDSLKAKKLSFSLLPITKKLQNLFDLIIA